MHSRGTVVPTRSGGCEMRRSYWIYSTGLAGVWAVVLIVAFSMRGAEAWPFAYVFGGFVIGWASTTIARYVYPPPRRWTEGTRQN